MLESTPPTTGRYIVTFGDDVEEPAALLSSAAGVANVASARDFAAGAVEVETVETADATVFDELGVAVVSGENVDVAALSAQASDDGAIVSVWPELIHHVLPTTTLAPPAVATFQDTAAMTWGLQATAVATSPHSGAGIKVAVLDTGFDETHPDFAGRTITSQAFVQGVTSAHDGHGHGTHCVGTSCGPQTPPTGPRYGVAYGADIFVGKVLSDQGSGSDSWILNGMNWALASECDVVSMSLGANVAQVHPAYRAAGRRALNHGTLIVAAAGNNANRPGNVGFVGVPANSPNIMAVGALDEDLAVTFFSARSNQVRGGQVDVAGPGLHVYSSWPMPTRYNTISGTSMATPHAAGIAALWAEATKARGWRLWATLAKESQRILQPSADVGGGLIMAPQ
jgi:subtilisin family serine protease